jgi:uncharacterized protein YjbI with pentapeptide repeats
LAVLSRPFEFRRKFRFGVSVTAFAPISEQKLLLKDSAMWSFLSDSLPTGFAVDSGIPKVGSEFLVVGKAFAAGGMAVKGMRVGVKLGGVTKMLEVAGDRFYNGKRASTKIPFTEMQIVWERAYGGSGFAENPLGTGADIGKAGPDNLVKLPNISERTRKDGDLMRPAGYGPIDVMWPQRAKLAGTHGDTWLKEDFPGFARDIDWHYFNQAPANQWFAEPLAGTEEFAFEGMHPEKKLVTGKLPGILPRLFVIRKGADALEEIKLALTTVWFFPDKERMVLVHHGTVDLVEEDAGDITQLLVGADKIGAPRPAEAFAEALRLRSEKSGTGSARALDDGLLVPREWLAPDQAALERDAQQAKSHARLHGRMVRAHEKMRAQIAAQGLDPDAHIAPLPPADPPPTLEELPAFIEKMNAEAEAQKAKQAAATAENDAKLIAQGISIEDIKRQREAKPKGPPAFSAHLMRGVFAAEAAKYRAMGSSAPQVEAALNDPETNVQWEQAERKVKDGYRLTAHHQAKADAVLPARNAEIRAMLERGDALPYDLHGTDLRGMDLSGQDLSGVCLDGANLAECNFTGAKMVNAVLAHADLRDCIFDGANLSGANLGRADLRDASLRGAIMKNAILAGAALAGAVFHGADLEKADVHEAQLSGASFAGASARGLTVIKTALRDWQAAGADFTGATFIESDLTSTDFSEAALRNACFVGCRLDGVNFYRAKLSAASFARGCSVISAQFAQSDVSGAGFREAAMPDCEFTQTNMEGADFSGTNLSGGILVRVRAVNAKFTAANLEKADLTHGNFLGADFYRANFRGANLTEAGFVEANLGRVQLDENSVVEGIESARMRYLPRYVAP